MTKNDSTGPVMTRDRINDLFLRGLLTVKQFVAEHAALRGEV